MADELNVQAQQGVNPLWPLGAAAVGGAGTYYGVNKYVSSPYKSVEDLIAEKEDTFNGKLQNATEQQKSLLEKAKAIREQAAAAGKEYDLKAEAYINSNGTKENPEFQELVKKQTEAEQALANRRAQIEQEVVSTTSKDTTKAVKALEESRQALEAEKKAIAQSLKPINSKINSEARNLFNLLNQLDGLEAKLAEMRKNGATDAQIAAKEKLIKDKKNAIKKATEDIFGVTKKNGEHVKGSLEAEIDKMVFSKKTSAKEIANTKKRLLSDAETYVRDIIAERTNNEARRTVAKNAVRQLGEKKANAERLLTDTYKSIASETFSQDVVNEKVRDFAKMEPEQITSELGRMKKVQQNKIAKLEALLQKVANGGNLAGEAKEVEELVRLGGNGKTDKEAIENAIKEARQKIANLDNAVRDIEFTQKEIARLGGVKIENGKLIDASGKEVKVSYDKLELPERKLELRTPELASVESKISNIENEIARQTEGNAGKLTAQEIEAKLEKEIAAVNDAKAAVEKASATLPKGEAKTAEELTKEVIEKYGTKENYIKKAVEKSENDIKALFEKKWGNKKIAGAVAAGTVLAGLIGYAIAPKNNS